MIQARGRNAHHQLHGNCMAGRAGRPRLQREQAFGTRNKNGVQLLRELAEDIVMRMIVGERRIFDARSLDCGVDVKLEESPMTYPSGDFIRGCKDLVQRVWKRTVCTIGTGRNS